MSDDIVTSLRAEAVRIVCGCAQCQATVQLLSAGADAVEFERSLRAMPRAVDVERIAELGLQVEQLTRDLLAANSQKLQLEGQLERAAEGDVCWHCHDELEPAARPRCETCPHDGECDVEGCTAPGCAP